MIAISKIKELQQEHNLMLCAFNNARTAANDTIEAVRARIRSDKENAAQRISELEEIISNPNSSDIVVNLARKERAKLSERVFTATDDELSAFYGEIEKADTLLEELKAIRSEFNTAYIEAANAMQSIRSSIVETEFYDLAPRWIDGLREAFDMLL